MARILAVDDQPDLAELIKTVLEEDGHAVEAVHGGQAALERIGQREYDLVICDLLTIHADRGQAMTSKSVALLLADLGVTKTHSRPHLSNDNPYSEAHFKTLKYRPAFPDRFGSLQDARVHGQSFFTWYNTEHHHSGLGLLTPYDVHSGLAEHRVAARAIVLAAAHAAHPERFPRGLPQPPARPTEVWINRPRQHSEFRGLTLGSAARVRQPGKRIDG